MTDDDRALSGLWIADDGSAIELRAATITVSSADGESRTANATILEPRTVVCDELALTLTVNDDGTECVSNDSTVFTRCDRRRDPHPRCERTSSYWKLSSHDERPSLSGREQPVERVSHWCDARCVRCGFRCSIEAATDDSGTGWRQWFLLLRCDRCGRWSVWHYDD